MAIGNGADKGDDRNTNTYTHELSFNQMVEPNTILKLS